MKPKIVCGTCGSPVTWGDRFCGSCGTAIEWPEASTVVESSAGRTIRCGRCGAENEPGIETCTSCGGALPSGSPKRRPHAPQQTHSQKAQQTAPSWKLMAGFVLVLAIGAVSLELLTAKKVDNVPHTHEEQPVGANLQALPQIEDMERRVAANPNDHQLLLQLSNLLHDSRFYDKAIQRYSEYLKKNPRDVDARVDLGICYYETDRTAEAKQQMLKALEIDPKHLLGNFNLGIVHLRIAQREMSAGNTEQANKAVEEANAWFRKTAALDPNGAVGQRAQRLLSQHGQP